MRRGGPRDTLLAAALNSPKTLEPIPRILEEEAYLAAVESRPREKVPGGFFEAAVPIPRQFFDEVQRRKKLDEARKLLDQADQLWEKADDAQSPALYQQLLRDYPIAVDDLQVRVRVTHRAREAGK